MESGEFGSGGAAPEDSFGGMVGFGGMFLSCDVGRSSSGGLFIHSAEWWDLAECFEL